MLFVILLVLVAADTGNAQPVTFFADLTNEAETAEVDPTTTAGDPRPASFGNASLSLNADRTALTFTAEIFNIDVTGSQTADTNDNLMAAHIHAGPDVTPDTNGGVVWGFFGSPFNDNNPTDTVVTPFATGVGGTFTGKWDAAEGNNTTLTAQLPNILEGRSYLNFHTSEFGGGEIRGNITVIPEPASILLAGCGSLLALALIRRHRTGVHG
jgi:hypothetical protein